MTTLIQTTQRAHGFMLGQLCGDSLGSLVEFMDVKKMTKLYPHGVRNMSDGGTWDLLAGQPTDDSEMAILLLRSLVNSAGYSANDAWEAYKYWGSSQPFDCGNTIASALLGMLNYESQANGALMRVSPIGIWGSTKTTAEVFKAAVQDAGLTHPNEICKQVNGLFASCIAEAIRHKHNPKSLYEFALDLSDEYDLNTVIKLRLLEAQNQIPATIISKMGWVLNALQIAFFEMLNAENPVEGIVHCINQGGDTDTNAAITGSLLGAIYGAEAWPNEWINTVLNCKPSFDNEKAKNPRPAILWPTDALSLVDKVLEL